MALRYLDDNAQSIKGGFLSDNEVSSMVNTDLENIRREVLAHLKLRP